MKLKITRPGGEVWEMEGTAEELAKLTGQRTVPPISLQPAPTPPVFVPAFQILDPCPMGGSHEYPELWWGVNSPPCKKCGKAATPWATPTWTLIQNNKGVLGDLACRTVTVSSVPSAGH